MGYVLNILEAFFFSGSLRFIIIIDLIKYQTDYPVWMLPISAPADTR